jgi:hypothetical protein
MNIKNQHIKYLKKNLVEEFIFLYICPLFLITRLSFSETPSGKTAKINVLISNCQILNSYFFTKGIILFP